VCSEGTNYGSCCAFPKLSHWTTRSLDLVEGLARRGDQLQGHLLFHLPLDRELTRARYALRTDAWLAIAESESTHGGAA
jgi:hypothetical protein